MILRGARVVDLGGAPRGGGTGAGAGTGGTADEPVDLRVADGRVVAIAPSAPVGWAGGLRPEAGEMLVDLDGRWVIPGMWDAHAHVGQWALARRRLDVAGAGSAAQVAALVVDRLRTDPPPDGTMLVAFGFRDGLWPVTPTATLLDDALAVAGLPPTPVVVVCGDLHSAWLSTPAMARLGVAPSCTGVVREDDWFGLMGRLDDVPPDVLDGWVAQALDDAAARGVVGVVDYELADNLLDWQRRMAAGTRGVRIAAGLWREHLDDAIARGLASGDALPATDGLLTMGALKVISDGSLNTRTAYCYDPYPGLTGPAAHGVLNVGTDELVPLMAAAARAGIHAAIHAIGDRANALALDAFAASGARGSIEHAQLLDDDDVARFVALDVAASVQPEHAMDDRDVIERFWSDRAERAFPLRRLHEAGVRLLLGSDAPVAPLDPWIAVSAAVDRTKDGREPWHPEQALTARVALAASVRSRVAVGQPADLAVLDADPLTVHGQGLRAMPVAGTLLAGTWTHTLG